MQISKWTVLDTHTFDSQNPAKTRSTSHVRKEYRQDAVLERVLTRIFWFRVEVLNYRQLAGQCPERHRVWNVWMKWYKRLEAMSFGLLVGEYEARQQE